MKKLVKLSIVYLGFILSLIFLQSCKNDMEDCGCNANFNSLQLKLGKENLNFKDYGFIDGDRYLTTTIDNKKIKEVSKIGNQNKSANDNGEIIAIFYVIDSNLHSINNDSQINTSIVDGIINYSLKNNKLLVTMYKKENNEFIPTIIENFETKFISSNDIYKLAESYLNINDAIVIAILNEVRFINENTLSDLQYATIDDIEGRCMTPCSNSHGVCTVDSAGNHCGGVSLDCPVEKSQVKITNNTNYTFDFINIKTDMRSFRDNYLKKSKGGIQLIKYYYEVGKYLKNNFTTNFAIQTFNILQLFQNKMNQLNNDPNGHNLYLSIAEINSLKNYFQNLKQQLNNQETIAKTDIIINLIDSFRNKTNYEVSQTISNFNLN